MTLRMGGGGGIDREGQTLKGGKHWYMGDL